MISGKWEKRGRSTLASHFAARTIRDEKCRMSEIGKGECWRKENLQEEARGSTKTKLKARWRQVYKRLAVWP